MCTKLRVNTMQGMILLSCSRGRTVTKLYRALQKRKLVINQIYYLQRSPWLSMDDGFLGPREEAERLGDNFSRLGES